MPIGEYHFSVQKSLSTCKSVIGQQHSYTTGVEPWWMMARPRYGVDRLGDDCLPVELLQDMPLSEFALCCPFVCC